MSATSQSSTPADPSQKDAIRALGFLAVIVVLLVLATYFVGIGLLVVVAIAATFLMLGMLIFLSSPSQRV